MNVILSYLVDRSKNQARDQIQAENVELMFLLALAPSTSTTPIMTNAPSLILRHVALYACWMQKRGGNHVGSQFYDV
eukprot:scaffold17839_cov72-Cyclotella_meneghiniana.AAC.5